MFWPQKEIEKQHKMKLNKNIDLSSELNPAILLQNCLHLIDHSIWQVKLDKFTDISEAMNLYSCSEFGIELVKVFIWEPKLWISVIGMTSRRMSCRLFSSGEKNQIFPWKKINQFVRKPSFLKIRRNIQPEETSQFMIKTSAWWVRRMKVLLVGWNSGFIFV